MLRIQATSYNNQALLQPLGADFDEMGGSIGRSEGNTLLLPDEKRYISRTQASISFRAGSYVLRDHGSATPTFVNNTPVGNGNEVALRQGDELRIGDYVLAVSEAGAVAGAMPDPFADLLPAHPSPSAPAPASAPIAASATNHHPDPFDDPFGLPASAPAATPGSGVIPHDFDPFADLMPEAAAPRTPSHDALNLTPQSGQSVDDLFGLKTADTWDPLAPESPLHGQNSFAGRQGADPFADLAPASSRPPQVPQQRDDSPMLSGAFRPPQARQEPAATPRPATPAPPKQAPPEPKPHAGDMVVSWDSGSAPATHGEIKTVILPSPKRGQAAPAESVQAQAAPSAPAPSAPRIPAQAAIPSSPAPAVARPPAPAAAASTSSAADASGDALLAAFIAGAGMEELPLPGGVTPEFMNLLGQLLRQSLSGTLELLLARALTKREVRAQATVIVARENNPLKFSPNVDAALKNLLVTQSQGFMTPVNAVRDAYNDLRSHQFGLMAGMRAALEGVLLRFDPAQLEQRLSQRGMLASIMPSNRRARLWELYEQLYRDISKEAEDDFQTLFGKAFLRAYEAQIDKLEGEDAADKR